MIRSCAVVLCVLLALACTKQKPEDALRLRISQYEQYWAAKNLEEVWKVMSPRLQQGNDNNSAKFQEFVRNSGTLIARIQVQDIRVIGDQGTVRALVTYRSPAGEELGDEVEESKWIFRNGEWFFDDYRSVTEPSEKR